MSPTPTPAVPSVARRTPAQSHVEAEGFLVAVLNRLTELETGDPGSLRISQVRAHVVKAARCLKRYRPVAR